VSVDPTREAERLLQTAWGNKFPVDPVQIARDLGADVLELELEPGVAGAIYKGPGEDPTIILNDGDSANRKRFTAAHELGHLIMHADDPDTIDFIDYRHALDAGVERDAEEDFADKFASVLLMPAREVKRLKGEHFTASQMAVYFGVSPDAIYFRLNDLGLPS
jgi:Zn-dependent peptidase ImmA (M78 family)